MSRTRRAAVCMAAGWAALGALTVAAPVVGAPPGPGAFAAASLAPPDATLLVHVRDAKSLRGDGTLLPAQAALARLAGSRVLGDAWSRIATELGTDGAGLVDLVLGTDAVYLERPRDGGVEWAIATRIEQPVYDQLVAKLKPAIEGNGRVTFASQQIAAAWRAPWLVLSGAQQRALLDAVVERLEATQAVPSLADQADLVPLRSWEVAPIELVWRHGAPTGGTTAVAARAADGALRLRHRSRWEKAPFHVASGAAADAGVLRALEPGAIAVLSMNPWRGALDPGEPIDALLLEGQIDDAMRANMGARQAVVVGERAIDGTRMRVPTLGIAFEVRDPVLAEKQWDGWARRLVESLARRVGEAQPPAPTVGATGTARSAAIAPMVRSLFSDHPLLQATDLAWVTSSGAGGAWQLVATDPALLEPMARALAGAVREADSDGAHELGALSGVALASHLRSWGMEARRFAPEAAESFAQAVALAAEIAGAAQQVRWRAKALDGGVVESEVLVMLPAPAKPPEKAP